MTARTIRTPPEHCFVGEPVYVVRRVSEHGHVQYWAQSEPERRNMSKTPLLDGWAGTTNGLAVYALGLWRVTAIEQHRDPNGARYLGGAENEYDMITVERLPDAEAEAQFREDTK